MTELPIKFSRVVAGVYMSTCGRWRIHKTTHTGHQVSHQGRVRWHVTDLQTNQPFRLYYHSGNYTLSLEDAIQALHKRIGRGIADGFHVLSQIYADLQRQANALTAREARINKRAEAILAWCSAQNSDLRLLPRVTTSVALDLAAHLEGDALCVAHHRHER